MSFVVERIVPPVLLGVLLCFQFVHGYADWVHYHGIVYLGIFGIPERDRPFLPTTEDMKHLAIELGAREGIGLTDRNIDVAVVQNVLWVSLRLRGNHDWKKFFEQYNEVLTRAAMSRWKQEAPGEPCACSTTPYPVRIQGWSVARGAWIKPLDLLSLAVLSVAFIGSLTGRGTGWKK